MAFKGQKRLKPSSWEFFPWARLHAVKTKTSRRHCIHARRGLHLHWCCHDMSIPLPIVTTYVIFINGSRARTTDTPWSLFSSKSQTFGLGQTIWADKFWGIWGILEQFISTHFGTVSPLSMFSINQPLFLKNPKPLNPNPKYLFGIGIGIWVKKN